MGITVYDNILRYIRLRCNTPRYRVIKGRHVLRQFFNGSDYLSEVDITHYEEYHIIGPVPATGKAECIFCTKTSEQFRFSKNVSSKRMFREDKFLEIIEYQFGGAVLITLNLVNNYLYLFFNLVFGKCAVENDICKKLCRTHEMFFQKSRVDHGFLLVGIGVKVASHILHAVQNMPCLAVGSTFEQKMLYKVGYSLFVFLFIACAGIYGISAVDNICRAGRVYYSQSILKCMC